MIKRIQFKITGLTYYHWWSLTETKLPLVMWLCYWFYKFSGDFYEFHMAVLLFVMWWLNSPNNILYSIYSKTLVSKALWASNGWNLTSTHYSNDSPLFLLSSYQLWNSKLKLHGPSYYIVVKMDLVNINMSIFLKIIIEWKLIDATLIHINLTENFGHL